MQTPNQATRRDTGAWQCPVCHAYGWVFTEATGDHAGLYQCQNCGEYLRPPEPIVTGL